MNYLIVLFSDFPHGTAMGRRYFLLSKGLREAGNKVTVLAGNQLSVLRNVHEIDGLKVVGVKRGSDSIVSKLSNRFRCFSAFRRILKKKKVDVCIFVYPDLDRIPFVLYSRMLGVKVVCTYDDERIDDWSSVFQCYLYFRGTIADWIIPKLSNALLVISTGLMKYFSDRFSEIPSQIVPPIVDRKIFRVSEDARERYRRKHNIDDSIVVAYLGTYWVVEGLAGLICSFRDVVSSGLKAHLIIAGKAHIGFPADDVSKLIIDNNLSESITETGWLDKDGVLEIMSSADIFVLPKLDHSANRAGMPSKLAEYLSFGKPVICSNVGDISNYIQDGVNVVFVKPGCQEQLSSAIIRLSRNDYLRRELGCNAKNVDAFDYTIVGEQVSSFVQRVA